MASMIGSRERERAIPPAAPAAVSTSLARRITISTVVAVTVVLAFAALGILAVNSLITRTDAALEVLEQDAVGLLDLSSDTRNALGTVAATLDGSLPADAALGVIASLEADMAALEAHLLGPDAPHGVQPEAEVLRQGIERWRESSADIRTLLAGGVPLGDPRVSAFLAGASASADLFRDAHTLSMERVDAGYDSVRQVQRRFIVGTVLLATLLVGFVFWRVRVERDVFLKPVQALRARAERAARGEYDEPLPTDGPAELAALAEAFNAMLDKVRDREAMLVDQALRDPLTGLGNRTMLKDRLEAALARRRRAPEERSAFMLIDLDGFKIINDTLGHSAGDDALRTVAQRLQASLREGDTLVRLGGDEFAVVAEDVGDHAEAVAARIVGALGAPMALDEGEARLTASVGVVYLTGMESTEDLLHSADSAMYRAKRAGGDQAARFEASMLELAAPGVC